MIARRQHHRAHSVAKLRSSWKGNLRFGLVSFGVEAVNVQSRDAGPIHFHQLHAACHHRIHYQKVCPIHGEVSQDEIVSGYEYQPGKYIEVEPDELDELRTEQERTLTIDTFIRPEQLDPVFFDGRMYYLLPASADAREPYRLLHDAMLRQKRWGIGQVVFSGKDQLTVVRTINGLLSMAMLNYASELRPPEEIEPDSVQHHIAPNKLKLAEDLIKSWSTRHFDLAKYRDRYRDQLKELLEAKAAGREVIVPEQEEEPAVINLTEALKRSITGGRVQRARAAHSRRSTRAGPRAKAKRKHAS